MVTSDATLNGPSEERRKHLESLISILTYAGEKDVPKTQQTAHKSETLTTDEVSMLQKQEWLKFRTRRC